MNILTFDIEEWVIYNYYDKGGKAFFLPVLDKYLSSLLDLLDRHHQKATFFCLGQLAKEYPEVIQRIVGRNHDIGCHSNIHTIVSTMNRDSFYRDTRLAIQTLEDVCGKNIISYRAPAFSITEQNRWAFEILVDLGIQYDSSVFPASHSLGGLPALAISKPFVLKFKGKELKEFPVNSKKILGKDVVFSGGGYFRLVPYFFIKKWTEESSYTMTYFHIRDFDKEQKVVYSRRYFQSYYGIHGAFEKFQKYLNGFRFLTIEEANQQIEWEHAPIVSI